MLLLFESDDEAGRFNFSEFVSLPSTVVWGIDREGKMLDQLRANLNLSSEALPLFVVCDPANRIVHISHGYTINLGEQLLKVMKKL